MTSVGKRHLPAARSGYRALAPLLAFVLAGAACDLAATTPDPQPPVLGEAPLRHESQDISGWRPRPKAARTREQVVGLYHGAYVPGSAAPLVWTGSIAGCQPGTTSVEHQQAVIDRVNYYRALVDLPAVSLLAGTPAAQSQAAALMMSANNALSHAPPSGWTCYSAEGAAGAGSANIALGAAGVAAIDLYMADPGAGNTAVGHRRWILFPPRAAMATGDVSGGNTPPRPANALHIFGPSNTRPATPDGVAWPPAGYVPYQSLPAASNRWSYSFPGADFTHATISMVGPGGSIPVQREPLASGFGDNTVAFLPAGVSYAQPSTDTTYTVTIQGIEGAGAPASVQYSVTVIDPEAPPPAPQSVEVVEYYHAGLDHYFVTWIPEEIAILDAGTPLRGWQRTGSKFRVYASAGAGTSPVCRYYMPPQYGDSHFYGRGTVECQQTGRKNPGFVLEDPNFMHVVLPDGGACPAVTTPVYRVFSNRTDANHRYMTDRAVRDQMVATGWLAEGDGPDRVVMCAPQ